MTLILWRRLHFHDDEWWAFLTGGGWCREFMALDMAFPISYQREDQC